MGNERTIDVVVAWANRWHGTRTSLPFFPITGSTPSPVVMEDVTVELIERSMVEHLCCACLPRGMGDGYPAVLNLTQAYSFVRRYEEPPPPEWDPNDLLLESVALSRLVHPNATAFCVSGRLTLSEDGKIISIDPSPHCRGATAFAFVHPSTERDFLNYVELGELAALVTAYRREELPKRMRIAFWHHENACRSEHAEMRWVAVSTGLEALTNTGESDGKVGLQFRERGAMLAQDLNLEIDVRVLQKAYDKRCALSHGRVNGLQGADLAKYEAIEALLRSSLRRAIKDPTFAAAFVSKDTIRARWPVNKRKQRGMCILRPVDQWLRKR